MEIKCTMSEVEILTAITFWLTEHKGLEVKEQPYLTHKDGGSSTSPGVFTATCPLGKPEKEVVEDAGV